MQYELIRLLQQKIGALENGQEFTLPKLLGAAWDKIHDGATVGKEFKELVRDQREISGVRLVTDKAGNAVYQKKAVRQ